MNLLVLLCLLTLSPFLAAQELDENAITPAIHLPDVAADGVTASEPQQQPDRSVSEEIPEHSGGVVVEETPEQPEEPGDETVPENPEETGDEEAPQRPSGDVDVEQQGESGAQQVPGEAEAVSEQSNEVVDEEGAEEVPEGVGLPQQGPQGAPSGFVCPEREGRFPRPEQCQTYYLCSRGVAYVAWCQGGLHFNPTSKACENPATAGCGVAVQTTPAPPNIELPEVCLAAKPEENCGWWQYARYYYNPEMDRCFRFRTSCTDPGNNFPNLLACRKKCMTRINPICLANKPEGKCGGTQLGRYYFDPKLDQCVYFTTGCPDNPSIFQSHAECSWTCQSEH